MKRMASIEMVKRYVYQLRKNSYICGIELGRGNLRNKNWDHFKVLKY